MPCQTTRKPFVASTAQQSACRLHQYLQSHNRQLASTVAKSAHPLARCTNLVHGSQDGVQLLHKQTPASLKQHLHHPLLFQAHHQQTKVRIITSCPPSPSFDMHVVVHKAQQAKNSTCMPQEPAEVVCSLSTATHTSTVVQPYTLLSSRAWRFISCLAISARWACIAVC